MDDLISRRAVLDVVEREEFKGDAISEIEKLPSVQPEMKVIEKIRAEIENVTPKAKFQTGKTSVDVQMMIPQEKVLQIIDKYIAESEEV